MQRSRHGPRKNLAQGIGGLVVGAALVLLAVRLLRPRPAPTATPPRTPANPEAS
jgi:hypothetical protein